MNNIEDKIEILIENAMNRAHERAANIQKFEKGTKEQNEIAQKQNSIDAAADNKRVDDMVKGHTPDVPKIGTGMAPTGISSHLLDAMTGS